MLAPALSPMRNTRSKPQQLVGGGAGGGHGGLVAEPAHRGEAVVEGGGQAVLRGEAVVDGHDGAARAGGKLGEELVAAEPTQKPPPWKYTTTGRSLLPPGEPADVIGAYRRAHTPVERSTTTSLATTPPGAPGAVEPQLQGTSGIAGGRSTWPSL
nr:unnamed protein product [Digitaria exilis]